MGKHNKESFKPIMGQSKLRSSIDVDSFLITSILLQVFVSSKLGRVSFYKDQKTSKNQPEQTFRGESVLELQGANVEIASDYTKKKHVFRIK